MYSHIVILIYKNPMFISKALARILKVQLLYIVFVISREYLKNQQLLAYSTQLTKFKINSCVF